MSTNQLTNPFEFNLSNVIFSEPKENVMELKDENNPNAKPTKITFHRIDIKYRNPDKTIGDLIIGFDKCTSAFGLSPKYGTFHINMCDQQAPTEHQLKTIEVFNNLVDKCRDHIMDIRVALGKPKMNRSNLEGETDISPLKFSKKDIDPNTGDPVKGAVPNLSVKLIPASKKDTSGKKFRDTFYSEEDDSLVDPDELIEKRCQVTAAVKIESIFVGNVIKVQTKLWEAIVKLADSGPKRLLQGFKSAVSVSSGVTTFDPLAASADFEDDEDSSSTSHSESTSATSESNPLQASDDEGEKETEPEVNPEPVVPARKGRGKK